MKNIRAIIWDLDGVFYRYSEDFNERCVLAAAKTAIEMGLNVTLQKAIAIAKESYATTGSSLLAFWHEHKLNSAYFHRRYHEHIDISHFPVDFELMVKMKRLPVTHAIITHGSSDWARRVVNQRGVGDLFSDDNIIGMEKMDFASKAESSKPFLIALEKLGMPPPNAMMVEDSSRNLLHAHKLGMKTAFLHFGNPQAERAYIDHNYDCAHQALDHIYNAMLSPATTAQIECLTMGN